MKGKRLGEALAMLALLAVAVGCGSSSQDSTTVTVTESEPLAPAAAEVRSQRSPKQEAEQTVRSYYRAIDQGAFPRAWRLLSPALQSELGGFSAWRGGYDLTIRTEAFGIDAVRAKRSEALVDLEIESTDIDECGDTVHQTFTGSWSLASEGGRFRATAFDVEKTSGGTPVTNPASCEYEESEPSEYAEEPESYESSEGSGCDPNYTGCVPEGLFDVDCDEVGEEVEVVGEDIYGLDLEEDGYACEIY